MSGEYLRLSLKDGSTVEGYLYCRDPESGNVVIFNGGKEEKPHPARMVIVMKHAIHNESVSSPTSIAVEEKGVHTMLASSAYQIEVGEDAKRERRTSEDVEKMFKKLRIPFTLSDNGVFELEGGEKVLPPYRPS
eukprot:CAMPEP_0113898306 /NCGR_PEP_ID=MMETSP0780_2-20120614/19290_1 /TAXON_ID=652834 /ORGANISM="Palpitomonas bilix" /LENGTH=133 /DNA_ID=CAMNT_0000890123 /DNA_START=314 /DNA_END=712 /DNA_ORIENTATION=- /assembly_acc=CAM_ASM_000599